MIKVKKQPNLLIPFKLVFRFNKQFLSWAFAVHPRAWIQRMLIDLTMKKKVFCTTVFSTLLMFAYAQGLKGKSYLELSIGPSIPVGDYGQKDLMKSEAGLAKLGEYVSISFTKFTSKNFGFTGSLLGQKNPLNVKALESGLSNATFYQQQVYFWDGTSGIIIPPATESYYKNWEFSKSSWYLASALLGAYYNYSVKAIKNVNVFANANIGAAYAWSPKISGVSNSDTASARIEQSNSSGAAFAYSLDLGLNYAIAQKTQLTLKLGYFGTSNITFPSVTASFYSARNIGGLPTFQQTTLSGDAKERITALNIGVGIRVRLSGR